MLSGNTGQVFLQPNVDLNSVGSHSFESKNILNWLLKIQVGWLFCVEAFPINFYKAGQHVAAAWTAASIQYFCIPLFSLELRMFGY